LYVLAAQAVRHHFLRCAGLKISVPDGLFSGAFAVGRA
jgi:hypothetical protein